MFNQEDRIMRMALYVTVLSIIVVFASTVGRSSSNVEEVLMDIEEHQMEKIEEGREELEILKVKDIHEEKRQKEAEAVTELIVELENDVDLLNRKIMSLETELEEMGIEINSEMSRWDQIMDGWTFKEFEITGYAPLDPNAIPNWDYCAASGPHATASGIDIMPGYSAASGPELPFGTELIVQGKGRYIVHDRGGLITQGKLDLSMNSKTETREWGRQTRMVAYRLPEDA